MPGGTVPEIGSRWRHRRSDENGMYCTSVVFFVWAIVVVFTVLWSVYSRNHVTLCTCDTCNIISNGNILPMLCAM